MRSTNGYKMIIIKVVVLVVVLLVFQVVFEKICFIKYQDGLLAAYIDKQKIVADEEDAVIFVGGSSVLFGVNAREFSRLSGRKAVNVGLQAMKSYNIYFETLDKYIGSGDTVVLGLEYEAYTHDWNEYDDVGLDLAWLSGYGSSLKIYQKISYMTQRFLRSYTRIWDTLYVEKIQPIFKQEEKLYLRENIDEYGDITGHEEMISTVTCGREFTYSVNSDALNYISDYIEDWERRGANVLITFPPMCISNDNEYSVLINEFYENLIEQYGDRIVGTPYDYLYTDMSVFLDTTYHLTYRECLNRTEQLYFQLMPNL